LSTMYPCGSDSGTHTRWFSTGFSQGQSETIIRGPSDSGFSQGSSACGRGSATYQASNAYTRTLRVPTPTFQLGSDAYMQGSDTYFQGSGTYTKGSDAYTQGLRTEIPPPVPQSPTTSGETHAARRHLLCLRPSRLARANHCTLVFQRPRSSTVRMATLAGRSLSGCLDFDVDRADGWTWSSDP
jgi:hypothetical protein